jgi:hypothetical protein
VKRIAPCSERAIGPFHRFTAPWRPEYFRKIGGEFEAVGEFAETPMAQCASLIAPYALSQ